MLNNDTIILDLAVEDPWQSELAVRFFDHVKETLRTLMVQWQVNSTSPYTPISTLTLLITTEVGHDELLRSTSPGALQLNKLMNRLDLCVPGFTSRITEVLTSSFANVCSALQDAADSRRVALLSTRCPDNESGMERILTQFQQKGTLVDYFLFSIDFENEKRSIASIQGYLFNNEIDIFGIKTINSSQALTITLGFWLFELMYTDLTVQFKSNSLNFKVFAEIVQVIPNMTNICACHGLSNTPDPFSSRDDNDTSCPRVTSFITSTTQSSAIKLGNLTFPVNINNKDLGRWSLLVSRRIKLNSIPLGFIKGAALLALPNEDIDEFDLESTELAIIYHRLKQNKEGLLLKGDVHPGVMGACYKELITQWFVMIAEEGSFSFTLLPLSSSEFCLPIKKDEVPESINQTCDFFDDVPLTHFDPLALTTGLSSRITSLLRIEPFQVQSRTILTTDLKPITKPNINNSKPTVISNGFKAVGKEMGGIKKGKKGIVFKRVGNLSS
ncbi:hypothetical protein P9112_004445 [Eukaryota sp. TZLM1-RC]